MLATWQAKAAGCEPGEAPVSGELIQQTAAETPRRYPEYREQARAMFRNFLELADR